MSKYCKGQLAVPMYSQISFIWVIVKWGKKKLKIACLQHLWNKLRYFLGLLIEGSPHAKVYYDIEIFLLSFPKENYNKKTLVFFIQAKGKKLFLGKKNYCFFI